MESLFNYNIKIASTEDFKYAKDIADIMAESAAKRGTGIAPRTAEYLMQKMEDNDAIIAINPATNEWIGFCYLEVWEHKQYIANSGLIIAPKYRKLGISKAIKLKIFEFTRQKYPTAKILSLTTSPEVIHVNEELGYRTVSNEEILHDDLFLNGRKSWVNYVDLINGHHNSSPYIAMIFDPSKMIPEAIVNEETQQKLQAKKGKNIFTTRKVRQVSYRGH